MDYAHVQIMRGEHRIAPGRVVQHALDLPGPGGCRPAPFQVGGVHGARAGADAAGIQARRDLSGEGREPGVGALRRLVGEDQRGVLVGVDGLFVAALASAGQPGIGAGGGPSSRSLSSIRRWVRVSTTVVTV